jgi:hypothetical protein
MGIMNHLTTFLKYYLSFIDYDLAKIYLGRSNSDSWSTNEHLKAAAQWICRAQDVSGDGGVARSYSLTYNAYFGRRGWNPSYPETTGYILPTMFDYAKFSGNGEMHGRAVRMADWECEVQMENGAVQGGTIDQPPTPAVFNTGQVIFGWVRAFLETGKGKYLSSARRAGEYLIREQDADGAWRKSLSNYASKKMETYTYNTRTSWSLMYLHAVTKEEKYKEGATRNIEFSLRQQLENGWFRDNCLWDPDRPVLHTIAYCIRGILETGICTGNWRYIEAARIAAEALLARQRTDGSLSGRFDSEWAPAASWSCLTGDAQTSIIWGRLYQETREPKFLEGMKRINRYLRKAQFTRTGNPGLFGGIAGSAPIHGKYGRFEVLSWAVKFFMDALMLEMAIEGRRVDG